MMPTPVDHVPPSSELGKHVRDTLNAHLQNPSKQNLERFKGSLWQASTSGLQELNLSNRLYRPNSTHNRSAESTMVEICRVLSNQFLQCTASLKKFSIAGAQLSASAKTEILVGLCIGYAPLKHLNLTTAPQPITPTNATDKQIETRWLLHLIRSCLPSMETLTLEEPSADFQREMHAALYQRYLNRTSCHVVRLNPPPLPPAPPTLTQPESPTEPGRQITPELGPGWEELPDDLDDSPVFDFEFLVPLADLEADPIVNPPDDAEQKHL